MFVALQVCHAYPTHVHFLRPASFSAWFVHVTLFSTFQHLFGFVSGETSGLTVDIATSH